MLSKIVSFVDSIIAMLNKVFPPVLVQFGVYASIGVLGAVLDLGAFAILNKYLLVMYLIAFFIGKTVGIINNFFLNATFNFKTSDKLISRFVKFYTIGLIGMGIGAIAMYVAVNVMKFDSLVSNVVITFVVAVIQFGVNRVVSFKK